MTVNISGEACILLALLLLTLPLPWLGAMLVAAAWHECCHALAVAACGGRIFHLEFGCGGARMETGPLETWQELLCALAGPAGSFLLLLFAPWVPGIALCGLGQGAFNLLPLYPLDGGRVMACLFPRWHQRGEPIVLAALLILTLWGAAARGWGLLPTVVLALAFLRRKKPCKSSRFRVQ